MSADSDSESTSEINSDISSDYEEEFEGMYDPEEGFSDSDISSELENTTPPAAAFWTWNHLK